MSPSDTAAGAAVKLCAQTWKLLRDLLQSCVLQASSLSTAPPAPGGPSSMNGGVSPIEGYTAPAGPPATSDGPDSVR